jgi:hypothetical protein
MIGGKMGSTPVHFSHESVAFGLFIAHDDAETLAYYVKCAIDAEDRERENFLGTSNKLKG